MPLHISEIGVRMAVQGPGDAPGAAKSSAPEAGSGGGGGCGGEPSGGLTAPQRKDMVEECVRAMLRAQRMREAR
jgi:hypothetical protein